MRIVRDIWEILDKKSKLTILLLQFFLIGSSLLETASIVVLAPFIGLFGTVWGIMNSFQSIATSKNTSLAIVAPGIAEALLATAMGLLAAIPAVMAYNKISSETNRYYNSLENFLYDLSNILSRHIHNKK